MGMCRWPSFFLLYLFVVCLGLHGVAVADDEPVLMSDFQVYGSSIELPDTVRAFNLSDELRRHPSANVRIQGKAGMQADLSIRESAFSEAGIALEGMALRNAQTEHFHAELPFAALSLSRPVVEAGAARLGRGTAHPAGTVFYDLEEEGPDIRLQARAGSDRYLEGMGAVRLPMGEPNAKGASLSLFGGSQTARDVVYGNDLDAYSGGGMLQYNAGAGRFKLAAGHSKKTFGATGFYGVSPALEAEETLKDSLALLSWRQEEPGALGMTFMAREMQDEYNLTLSDGSLYQNEHRTRWYAWSTENTLEMQAANLYLRSQIDREELDSNRLGEYRRERAEILLLPEWDAGAWLLCLGAKAVAFTDDHPAWLPQASIMRKAVNYAITLAYSETVRQPSYTELSYESPGSLGNQNLERQEAREVECRLDWQASSVWSGSLAAFYRDSGQAVDWIKTSATNRWTAQNIRDLKIKGCEWLIGWRPGDLLSGNLFYRYIEKDADEDIYAGRYQMDYAKHRVGGSLVLDWTDAVTLSFHDELAWYEDNPERNGGSRLHSGSIKLAWILPITPQVTVSASAENAWDDDFQVLAGQASPGRSFVFGMEMVW